MSPFELFRGRRANYLVSPQWVNENCAGVRVTDMEWRKSEVAKGVARKVGFNTKMAIKRTVVKVVIGIELKNL